MITGIQIMRVSAPFLHLISMMTSSIPCETDSLDMSTIKPIYQKQLSSEGAASIPNPSECQL